MSNLAIPGEKTEGGAERIDQALASVPGAKVFIIMHGGNDWVGAFREPGCDKDCEPEVKEANYVRLGNNLRTMRKYAVDAGKRVVFATYWPSSPVACNQYSDSQFVKYQSHMKRLNAELAIVGEEFGDQVVRLDELKEMASEADNFFDCLHPSPKGYEKITDRWAQNEWKWAPQLDNSTQFGATRRFRINRNLVPPDAIRCQPTFSNSQFGATRRFRNSRLTRKN